MNSLRKHLTKLTTVGVVGVGLLMTGATSAGAAGTTGPFTSGNVQCISKGGSFAGGSNLQAVAAKVRAFNYTSGVDRQTVTMQPVVWRWNGSAWVEAVFGEVLKGTATDSASPTTWFHNTTNASWGAGTQAFRLPPANFYSVAYKLNWFYSSPVSGNPPTLSGSQYVWATGYSLASPFGGPVQAPAYCTT